MVYMLLAGSFSKTSNLIWGGNTKNSSEVIFKNHPKRSYNFSYFLNFFQVYPLRHKGVMPHIPIERQSLLVQGHIAALGGELDCLSIVVGITMCEMLG